MGALGSWEVFVVSSRGGKILFLFLREIPDAEQDPRCFL